MKKYSSIKEIAALWQIDEAMVTRYCRQNRIAGAIRDGKKWLIPSDATKPVSLRSLKNKAVLPTVSRKEHGFCIFKVLIL